VTEGAWCFDRFGFQAVFLHREKFIDRLGPLPLSLAAPLHALRGWSAGHPPYRELNVSVSRAMQRRGLARLAILGPPPGLWTLRPAPKSPVVPDRLPDIVRAVESGRVPEAQRGDGELDDSLPEWSAAPEPEPSASPVVMVRA